MRLGQLRTHGIGAPFRDREVTIDFEALGPGVIAVIGANGSGKTHVIELSGPGVIHRELPSYRDPKGKKGEPLIDHVHPDTRDAFVEETFHFGGHHYRIRVNLDGRRRKTEAFVWRDHEPEPFVGPLPSAVEDALATIIPSRSMLLAGPFACQGGFDGFFRLGPTERKALFCEMLGLGHLEALAEVAGEQKKCLDGDVGRLRQQLEALAPQRSRLEAIETELAALIVAIDTATATAAEAVHERDAARTALDRTRQALARLEGERAGLLAAYQRAVEEREAASQRKTAATTAWNAAAATLASLDRNAIAAAATGLDALDVEITAASDRERTATDELRTVETELGAGQAHIAELRAIYSRLTAERTSITTADEQLVAAEAAAVQADARRNQVEDLHAAWLARLDAMDAAEERVTRATEVDSQRRVMTARIATLRPQTGLLDRIPGVDACGTCPLTESARQALGLLSEAEQALAALPASDPEAVPARTTLLDAQRTDDDRLRTLQRELGDLERTATTLDGLRIVVARREACAIELEQCTTQGRTARQRQDEHTARQAALVAAVEAARADGARLTTERRATQALAALAPKMATADATLVATDDELVTATGALDRLMAEPLPVVPSLTEHQELVERQQAVLEAAERTHVEAATANEALRARRAELDGIASTLRDAVANGSTAQTTLDAALTAAVEWAQLAKALGKSGLQALLIDAAGPEVSAIANDLLATCYTPRFQIALTTTQPTADGKGFKEVFEPRLLDAEAGRDGTRGSGGETALIDAALRLSLVIVNTKRSGLPMETLWLDEANAALSAENAPKFVDMIRRAMTLGGFHQTLIVSHDRNIWETCDARLIVEDGAVRVWAAGTRDAA